MIEAYILVIIQEGYNEDKICRELMEIPEVEYADLVFGIYDIVVKVRAKSISDIGRLVIDRIRKKIEGIVATYTLIVV